MKSEGTVNGEAGMKHTALTHISELCTIILFIPPLPTLNLAPALLLFSPSLTCIVFVPHFGITILVALCPILVSLSSLPPLQNCILSLPVSVLLPRSSCPADRLLAFQEVPCFI